MSCISGRGIGMMAVFDELSSLHGEISIEFTAPEEGGSPKRVAARFR